MKRDIKEAPKNPTEVKQPQEIDLKAELQKLRKPKAGKVPLANILDQMVREGDLYEKLENDWVHCYACGHHCKIKPGARGICQIRYNLNGKLYVPWGYVVALQADPTEKKPFYHVYPGSDTLTFGMLGCDFHCSYCQNWDISQALRDPQSGRSPIRITPEEMVKLGKKYKTRCFASSYNEPLITSEWAVDIFKLAVKEGFTCLYVSNGNATREVLEYIRPYVTGYKIDLKTMNPKHYRQLGGVLENILDSIRMVHEMGFWEEIVTLIVPGYNDSEAELREAARFIKSVSPDIPWHVTAFHPDYKMLEPGSTPASKLIRAAEIGYEEGLHFVYAGNLPGRIGEYEHTHCPNCHKTLIQRFGYVILDYQITGEGTCPQCNTGIAGIWPGSPSEVRISSVDSLFYRTPRSVR